MGSVFAKYIPQVYPYNFRITLHIGRLAGGVPTDPKVAEGWLKTKLGIDRDDLLREMVAEVMVERGTSAEDAVQEAVKKRSLNGFKRHPELGLYIEGRQLKAAIKEAANVAWPKDRWGPSRKGTLSWFSEHVFVQEDVLPLGRTEADSINQRFVHTWMGSAIQHDEICDDVDVTATIATDYQFTEEQWATLWLKGQNQGIGASRSQGYGRYEVIEWEPLPVATKKGA